MTLELIQSEPVLQDVTLLFSDIVGSTELTVRLGDREALRLMDDHNAIVRDCLDRSGGLEVEQQGDGFLLAFPTALAGVRCAVRIQREMACYRVSHAEDLRVRIGVHSGSALRSETGYFGSAVILAARISMAAVADEILLSTDCAEQARVAPRRSAPCRVETLKGFRQAQAVIPVDWAEAPDRFDRQPAPAIPASEPVALTV